MNGVKMTIFNERFKSLYLEFQTKAHKEKKNFGFQSLGVHFEDEGKKLKSTTLKSYYDGIGSNPSLENLLTLAEFFDVSVSYLIGESDIRKPEYQDLEVFEKYGFDKETLESLIAISEKPLVEKRKYLSALNFLLMDYYETSDFPVLYFIGEYLTRIFKTGKNIVDLGGLSELKGELEKEKPDFNSILKLSKDIIESAEPYSIEELDTYYLSQITSYLKQIRKWFDDKQIEYFESLKGKSETYIEKLFNNHMPKTDK